MDLNRITLIGRIGRDPALRTTPSGVQVASFSLATGRYMGKDREQATDWHNITWWRPPESFIDRLRKGSLVYVEGQMIYESWEKDDQRHTRAVVDCKRLDLLSQPSGTEPSTESPGPRLRDPSRLRPPYTDDLEDEPDIDDDLPF